MLNSVERCSTNIFDLVGVINFEVNSLYSLLFDNRIGRFTLYVLSIPQVCLYTHNGYHPEIEALRISQLHVPIYL